MEMTFQPGMMMRVGTPMYVTNDVRDFRAGVVRTEKTD